MSSIDQLVEQIKQEETTYTIKRGSELELAIKRSTFVPLFGAFAVGKNTIMAEASRLDSDFGRIRSFTTREPRANEVGDEYIFLPHTERSLEEIIGRIATNELLQFTVHPTTGHIYGSAVDSDDISPFLMLDTLPAALPSLSRIPFGNITKVAVATPPEAWLPRFEARMQAGNPEDVRKRLLEGISNISFSLNEGADVRWISNGDRDITEVAQEFIEIVRGTRHDSTTARNDAEDLSWTMQQISTQL